MKRLLFASVLMIGIVSVVPATAQEKVITNTTDKRISLDFRSGSLADIVYVIAKETGHNLPDTSILAGETVSVYATAVTADEALNLMLPSKGFSYTIKDKTIYIVRATVEKPVQQNGRVLGQGRQEYLSRPRHHDGRYLGGGISGGYRNSRYLYEEQLVRRLERQFEAENEWGAF